MDKIIRLELLTGLATLLLVVAIFFRGRSYKPISARTNFFSRALVFMSVVLLITVFILAIFEGSVFAPMPG